MIKNFDHCLAERLLVFAGEWDYYTVSLHVGIEGDCDDRKFAGTTLNTFGEDY